MVKKGGKKNKKTVINLNDFQATENDGSVQTVSVVRPTEGNDWTLEDDEPVYWLYI